MSKNNENNNSDLKDEQKAPKELENTVENLQTEVKRLEKLVEVFRDTITRLEKENKGLTEKCEALEIKKVSHPHEIETVVHPEPTPPSSQAAPFSEEPKITVIETAERRRTCPSCGNQNFRLIREVIDRTKLISVYPRIYGKKLKCGECGIEWR